MSAFGKKKEVKSAEKIQVHFVFIEETLDKVAPLVMTWEESSWWPKLVLQVRRKTPGPIQAGTTWIYKLPMLPGWTAQAGHCTPDRMWASTFTSGILKGGEAIRIEERANGTKVEYQIQYQAKGPINKILWAFFGESAHNNAIKKILAAFREHVIKNLRQEQENKFEGQK